MRARIPVARLGRGGIIALSLLSLALCPVRAPAADLASTQLLLDAARSGSDLVVVGERGTILRSTDDARTWQRTASPTRATLTGVTFAPASAAAPSAPGHGWAVGHDALILSTTDGGRTWTKQFQGDNLEDSFLDVLAIDPQRITAVGAYGLFASTVDGGKTWTPRKLSAEDYHFNRITIGPTGTLYIAGERGTLLRSLDRGDTWLPLHVPYEGSFYGILPLDDRTLLAYGLRGHVYRSINDGATWSAIATPQPTLLATGIRTPENIILLAGHAGTLLLSRDDGISFTAATEPPATAVAELLPLAAGVILAVGESGAVVLAPIR